MESLWTTGKRVRHSTFCVRFFTDTLSRNSSLYDTKCHRRGSSAWSHEVKNELGAQFQCRCLQEGRRQGVALYRWIFRRNLRLDSKDGRYRNCNSTIFPFSVFMLEVKIQKPGKYLFQFSLGGDVLDRRRWPMQWMNLKNYRDQSQVRLSRFLRC